MAGGIARPVGGFWETTKGVLLKPNRFFSNMPAGDGYSAPLLFAIFWGMFGALFSGLTNFGLINYDPSAWLISVLIAPVVAAVTAFSVSGVVHGFVRLWVGAGNSGFETTFRVVCYATASYVLYVIPFVGSALAAIYVVFLAIIGIRAAHSASVGKAVGVMLAALAGMLAIGAVGGAIGPEVSERTILILLP